MKKILYGIAALMIAVSFAGVASAQASIPVVPCSKPPCPATAAATQNNPLNIHLNNPLSSISTIPEAINKILSIVIRVALPLIIIFFIWSGLSFILARGNPTDIKKAKDMFFYTVIGTLLILGAWTITNAIIGTVNAIVN